MPNIGAGGVHDVVRSAADAQGGYTWTVTFASRLGDAPMLALEDSSSLTPAAGGVGVATALVQHGNVVRGAFRLAFEGDTTAAIAHDASAADVRGALEALDTIATVRVERVASDDQQGHTWAVTFLTDANAGDVSALVPVYEDTLYGTSGQTWVNVTTPTPGNTFYAVSVTSSAIANTQGCTWTHAAEALGAGGDRARDLVVELQVEVRAVELAVRVVAAADGLVVDADLLHLLPRALAQLARGARRAAAREGRRVRHEQREVALERAVVVVEERDGPAVPRLGVGARARDRERAGGLQHARVSTKESLIAAQMS